MAAPAQTYGPAGANRYAASDNGEVPVPSTGRNRRLGHSSRIHSAPASHRAPTIPDSLPSARRRVLVPFNAADAIQLIARYRRARAYVKRSRVDFAALTAFASTRLSSAQGRRAANADE